jgi:hypothetical protein
LEDPKYEHEDSDNEDEPHDRKKAQKKKKYATPIAEYIDVMRDRLKITVREFKYVPGQSEERKGRREQLTYALGNHTENLKNTLKAQFSDAFELYIHVKVVRMILETRMRFGSEQTLYYWLEPVPGKEKHVQGVMVEIFGDR